MTTVLAVQIDGDVIIGSDSLTTQGSISNTLTGPKFFAVGNVIYGVAGTTRLMDVLRFGGLPDYDSSVDGPAQEWIFQKWVPAFRDLLAAEPFLLEEDHSMESGNVFMVLEGVVYEMDSYYSWYESGSGIVVGGSGCVFALGALGVMQSRGDTIGTDEVCEALQVAARFDRYTGGTIVATRASTFLAMSKEKAAFLSSKDDRLETPQPRKGVRWKTKTT